MDYTTTALRTSHKESVIRVVKGLTVSLLLHLLILWLFTTNFKNITFLPNQQKEKKISLNLKQIVTPPPAPKPKPIPKPIVSPPMVKPILPKKVEPKPEVEEVKRTILDERKKTFATKSSEENNVTKVVEKPVKEVVKKEPKKKPKKKIVKKSTPRAKPQRRAKRSKDPLANMLMGSGTSMFPTQPKRRSGAGTYGEKMIKKLYGSEFNTYSPTQKKYIRNNLSTIHQITQRTLSRNGYPQVAIQTRQQGTNVVSFYLHPNGDISGLRLKTRIGYAALDDNTIKVIKLAYKDYPLPNKKTRLIFYVRYSIY
jgi:TonB family protein